MCGICCIISNSDDEILQDSKIQDLLKKRGPDYSSSKEVKISSEVVGFFHGSVLWMQGKNLQKQPIVDDTGDVFLWNGDNFNHEKYLELSDTYSLYYKIKDSLEEELISCFANVRGPWAFIYYSHQRKKIYFGRDIFGRRSLLWKMPMEDSKNSSFILCSVFWRDHSMQEVPALGIYVADIANLFSSEDKKILLYPFAHTTNDQLDSDNLKWVNISNHSLKCSIDIPLCKEIPSSDVIDSLKNYPNSLVIESLLFIGKYLMNEVTLFTESFMQAVQKRVNACPPKCKNCTHCLEPCKHSKFAVLFSGGLDSALIALFLSKCLPVDERIDLLNVSFANVKSATAERIKDGGESTCNFNTPDRISGIACWKELQSIDDSRIWNFVEVNVTSEELQTEREQIISHLIAPHSSVLDDSIGCALYFCCRGVGLLDGEEYHSPARVVFSGLGADEQLAGYSRHRGKFTESGWSGLVNEVELEMQRIHSRNCGRDDRIFSHHGRTTRFPYLDEGVVECLNSIPIWKKVNLYLSRGIGEKLLLRVVAAQNSLHSAAVLPKRAIQFGSRIAKLENSRERGNDVCNRLQSHLE